MVKRFVTVITMLTCAQTIWAQSDDLTSLGEFRPSSEEVWLKDFNGNKIRKIEKGEIVYEYNERNPDEFPGRVSVRAGHFIGLKTFCKDRHDEFVRQIKIVGFESTKSIAQVVFGGGENSGCYSEDKGFVAEDELKRIKEKEGPPTVTKKAPARKSEATAVCPDCNNNRIKSSYQSHTEMKQETMSKITTAAQVCSAPGSASTIQCQGIRLNFEVPASLKPPKTPLDACQVSIEGRDCRSEKGRQVCVCGDPNVHPLNKIVSIADQFFVLDKTPSKKICTKSLETFYDQCSSWHDLSVPDRLAKVQGMAKDILTEMNKLSAKQLEIVNEQKRELQRGKSKSNEKGLKDLEAKINAYKTSPAISPALLACMANKENADLEPLRISQFGCMARKYKSNGSSARDSTLEDGAMSDWPDDGATFNQMRVWVMKYKWTKWEDQIVPDGSGKTFKERFGNPDQLYKEQLVNPKLAMIIMAKHLSDNLNLLGGHSSNLSAAVRNYNGGQKKYQYEKIVMRCAGCLANNSKNLKCLPHPPPEVK